MNKASIKLTLLLLACSFASASSLACSWRPVIGEIENRVLIIGKIKGHIIAPFENRQVFGVVVEPLLEYRAVPDDSVEEYLFPHGIDAGCSNIYYEENERLRTYYAPGQLVTVTGYETPHPIPGNLSIGMGDGLSIVRPDCSVSDIESYELVHSADENPCGPVLFHAYKDISRLRTADEPEAVKILSRLSQARFYTQFEELVNSYVDSETDRARLLMMRYADAIETGCAIEPEQDYEYDDGHIDRRLQRSRWFEYCTRERIDAARDGA